MKPRTVMEAINDKTAYTFRLEGSDLDAVDCFFPAAETPEEAADMVYRRFPRCRGESMDLWLVVGCTMSGINTRPTNRTLDIDGQRVATAKANEDWAVNEESEGRYSRPWWSRGSR